MATLMIMINDNNNNHDNNYFTILFNLVLKSFSIIQVLVTTRTNPVGV